MLVECIKDGQKFREIENLQFFNIAKKLLQIRFIAGFDIRLKSFWFTSK